ncbi:lysylphosphatidylglycerol synthase transmembrane domain-containing protein [Chloroflexota bacterium]
MSETPIRAPNRSMLIRVIGTLIALTLLVYLLSQQGWEQIRDAVQQIPLWRIVLAFGLITVSRFAVAARWQVLLRSSGFSIQYRSTLKITYAGLFASNFLPTTIGGDVVRLAGGVQLGFDAAICAASIIVDRLVGMAGMLLTLPIGIASIIRTQFSPSQNPFFFQLSMAVPLSNLVKKIWVKTLELAQRIIGALGLWSKKPRALGISFLFTCLHMFCIFGATYLLLAGMGEDISMKTIAGLSGLVYFITLLPFTINGYGLQEISMTYVYYSLGEVSLENSLTTALLLRTLLMIASLPGALYVSKMLSGVGGKSSIPSNNQEDKSSAPPHEIRDGTK